MDEIKFMSRSVIFYIGLRYFRGQIGNRFSFFISSLSIIGIALGVTALIIVTSVMNGFEGLLQENILAYIPQAILTTHKGNLDPSQYPSESVYSLKGIDHISPIINSDVLLQSKRSIRVALMIGVEEISNDPLLKHLQSVDKMVLTAGSYHVILGIELAKQLEVNRGDKLRLILPGVSRITPIGRIPSHRLFTVVGFFSTKSEIDNSELLINQEDAARLMHYPIGNITGWRLYLNSPLSVDRLSKQKLPSGMIWQDWRKQKGEFFQAVKMEKNIMTFLLSLIIIVATFNIITSLSLLVMEKESEVAVLKTLGIKRRKVMGIFILQGFLSGIVGSFIGIILGLFIVRKLNTIMPVLGVFTKDIELPTSISAASIIFIVSSSVTLSLLATLYPSWCSTKIQPAKALRYE